MKLLIKVTEPVDGFYYVIFSNKHPQYPLLARYSKMTECFFFRDTIGSLYMNEVKEIYEFKEVS